MENDYRLAGIVDSAPLVHLTVADAMMNSHSLKKAPAAAPEAPAAPQA